MEVLLQSHPWTCMPAAFAIVLGLEPKSIMDYLGHDGSEVIWEENPEPYNRRGFHPQEMIDFCIFNDFVIPVIIDARPALRPRDGGEVYECVMPEERLGKYLGSFQGVLLGRIDNRSHAVAWDCEQCYDPTGRMYPVQDFEIETFIAFM